MFYKTSLYILLMGTGPNCMVKKFHRDKNEGR